jgi:hypothetical protein
LQEQSGILREYKFIRYFEYLHLRQSI